MAVVQVERINERRRGMRVEENGRAYVTERRPVSPIPGMHESLAPLFGSALNLSESGVLLELEEPIQPGRAVVVGMDLEGRTLEFSGIVTRVCRPRHSQRVHIGVRFTCLTNEAREAIGHAVDAGKFAPYLN